MTMLFPRRPRNLLTILALLLLVPFMAAAQETQTPVVTIKLIPERTVVESGEIMYIAIEQTIAPGWHTYWVNPGDSGAAMEVKWDLPPGFEMGEMEWPAPHKISYEGLLNYGYADKATILQTITAPAPLSEKPLEIKAAITLLVCKDICIPETSTHSFIINDGSNTDNTPIFDAAINHIPDVLEWDGIYREEDGKLQIDIDLTQPGLIVSDPALIPIDWGIIENTAEASSTLKGTVLQISQARGTRDIREIDRFHTLITGIDVVGNKNAVQIVAYPDPAWLAALPAKESKSDNMGKKTPAAADIPAAAAHMPDGADLTLPNALILALLGGLVLNLMPCVFPILSLKAVGLSKLAAEHPGRAAAHGMAYTLGILFSFGIVAGALMTLKAAGAQIGWGFQLQNPVIVFSLALLLFVIGLNLSGVFGFGGGLAGAGSSLAARGGLTGAFFTGVLATLVATPCTAPFMGAAIGFALTQPEMIGMTVFMALGLGLALPYLLISLLPPLRKCLPKPGAWMDTFKQFMAFPMYASAAWLVWVYAQQTGTSGLLNALFALVAVAFFLWAWSHRPRHAAARILVSAGLMTILIVGATVYTVGKFIRKDTSSANAAASLPQPYSEAALKEALAGPNPVFVNMTADWCITCKLNERVALNTDAAKSLFEQARVVYFKGDWTNRDAEITAFLGRYGRRGVPIYVYYPAPDTVTGARPGAIILPQILTMSVITDLLNP